MIVIQSPEGIKTGNGGFCALLPVNPPEIDAHFFVGVMKNFKVVFGKFPVRNIKFDGLFFVGILSHCPAHILVLILEPTYTL